MLLTAYCLLLTDFQGRDTLGEVGILFDCLVEAFSSPLSFGWDSSVDLGIRVGVATGLQWPARALSSFIGGRHLDHVDGLLFG